MQATVAVLNGQNPRSSSLEEKARGHVAS